MKMFRNITSLLLILVLSGPAVVKLVHDLNHSHEAVCNEAVELHFHKQEHNCNICDFTIGSPLPVVQIYSGPAELIFISDSDRLSINNSTLYFRGISSLRAPPVFT